MGLSTEELRILLSLDDEVSGKLSGVTKKFEGVGSKIQTVGKIAAGAAVGGIAALGIAAVKVSTRAISSASDLNESVNAVNVVFGEAADQVLKFGESADKSAGLAQSTFAQMAAQSGAMLQNLGLDTQTAADETIKLTQRAADMASIFNTDVGDALGAIQAGLRGEADPLERFGVRLNAAAVAAKAVEMGLADTTSEVDDAARAQASLALLYEQTDKIAGDFVNTSDGLANSARIQAAQWDNFMADIGSFMLPIVEQFQKVFMQIGAVVMPVVSDALAEVMPYVQAVADAFTGFIDSILSGESPLDSFKTLIYDIATTFGMSGDEADGLIQKITSLFEQIQTAVQPVIDFIARYVELKDVLIALGVVIAAAIIPVIISLVASMLPIILIIGAIIAVVALLRNAWENNWGGIQEKTQAVITFVKDFISNALEFIRGWWEEHGDQVIETVTYLWDKAKELFNNAVDFIKDLISKALTTIRDFWDDHGEQIKETAQNMWDAVVGIFEWFRDKFTELLDAFRLAREGDWEGFGEKLREIWDDTWEKIKEILGKAWDAIKEAISNGIDAIIQWFKDTDWGEVGRNIIQGVADGISAATQIIKDAARRAAKAAWEAAKGFFGIDSPSRLMMDVGFDFNKGLAMGIKDSAMLPQRAAQAMAINLAGAAQAGISNINYDNRVSGTGIYINNTAALAVWLKQQEIHSREQIDKVF